MSSRMPPRVAGPTGSLRRYRLAATALLVLGVPCLLVELQSPSLVFWTGERVQGTNDGGIVYYTVGADQRTLDGGDAPARPVPVVVYADPDDSTRDRLSSPARWFDAGFVLAPFVAAGGALVVGVVRVRRRDARLRAPGGAAAPRPSGSSRSRRSSR